MRRHLILVAALVWAAFFATVLKSGQTAASPLDPASPVRAVDNKVVLPPAPHSPNGSARTEPIGDTFVAIGIDEPKGSLNMLIAGELNNGDYETMIQFALPLDNMGSGADVTKATLKLFKRECVISDNGIVQLQARVITRPWDQNTVVWDRKPSSSGPVVDFDVPDPELTGYFSVDVTDVVREWYSGEIENFGWTIIPRFDMQARRCVFWASEAGHYPLASPPLLEIDWTGGVTPTFTPTSSPTSSSTPTASNTPTPSDTPTPTNTLDVTLTPTATNTPTSAPVYLPINLRREDIYVTFTPEPRTAVPATVTPEDTVAPRDTETPTATAAPQPDVTIELMEMGGSGMSGSGELTQMGADLVVDLSLSPPDTTVPHIAHIHEGSCDAQGPVTHPLEAVYDGMSHTVLTMVDLADVTDGNHYINVHESAANPGNIIACGEIPMTP